MRMVKRTAKETLAAFLGVKNPIGRKLRIRYGNEYLNVRLVGARWVNLEGRRLEYKFVCDDNRSTVVTCSGIHFQIIGVYAVQKG